MKHKIIILKLRSEGKSYSQIRRLTGCAKSTISYHCSTEENKIKNKKKKKKPIKIKKEKLPRKTPTYGEYINKWLLEENTGGREVGYGKVSNHVRRFLFEKFNNKCSECKWSQINLHTNTIPLEIDHIDGNPENHSPDNLTLLCPNCHSLTKGHSSSKGQGRRYYREKYRKEVGKLGFEPK